MVRIIGNKISTSNEGREFISLKVQGGIEPVQSANSGKIYLTAKTAFVACTFDEQTAEALVGTELPGKVERVACEPYDYVVKDTGETITLNYRYEYKLIDAPVSTAQTIASEKVHDLMELS